METTYLFVVEWNGKKPPATWYRDLLSCYGVSRHNRVGRGIQYLQEGVFLVFNRHSLLHMAHLAVRCGAHIKVYTVGVEVDNISACNIIDTDEIIRRRGRPLRRLDAGEKAWTVTCLSELSQYVTHTVPGKVCEKCGGDITYRPGRPIPVEVPPDWSVWDTWMRSRFALGNFEIPQVFVAEGANTEGLDTTRDVGFKAPPAFDRPIEGNLAMLALLDAAWVSRTLLPGITQERAEAYNTLIERGVVNADLLPEETISITDVAMSRWDLVEVWQKYVK